MTFKGVNFESDMTDDEIISVVTAIDRQMKPMSVRFEGDDDAVRTLADSLGVQQGTVQMHLLTSAVLREAAHRGLFIPKGNTPNREEDF